MDTTKTCTRCRRTLHRAEFQIDRQKTDGLSYWCRRCKAETRKARYGPPRRLPPDARAVAREAAATQWLAGIDARPWLPALPLGYCLPGMPPDPRQRPSR